jgi:hypothetical protein
MAFKGRRRNFFTFLPIDSSAQNVNDYPLPNHQDQEL